MAKFSGTTVRSARPLGPARTVAPAVTHEDGKGHEKDAKTALFTLSVANLVGETSFYEAAGDRDARFRALVAQVTREDPTWVAGLVRWLRAEGNMRSAAAVAAVEYVRAGGPNGRTVVGSACLRADEPGEVLAYWLSRYGRPIPKPVKRGIADAAARLYNERSLLKYDTPTHGVRFADVIGLCRPEPTAPWQDALFRHAADRRRNRARDERAQAALAGLSTVSAAYQLDGIPEGERRAALGRFTAGQLGDAGYTWERLAGWLPGGMDAEAWEAVIPSMGYMALLRNLRNFEQAKVRPSVLDTVAARLADPAQVARSRQFPYRFWSAYKNTGSTRFAWPLEQALEASVANIPELSGRTLVMVDTSGSMRAAVSSRSKVELVEIAALFAAAVAAKSDVTLCPYANTTYRTEIKPSVLRTVEHIQGQVGRVGLGTHTWPSTHEAITRWGPFDRVVVFSDVQDHPSWHGEGPPRNMPVYVWDLAGYAVTNVDPDVRGHYLFGGFTDAAFRMVGLLEAGRAAGWPWETSAAA